MIKSLLLSLVLPAFANPASAPQTPVQAYPAEPGISNYQSPRPDIRSLVKSNADSKVGVYPSGSINGASPWMTPETEVSPTELYRTGDCYYLFFGTVNYAKVDGQFGWLCVDDDTIWINKPFSEGPNCWIKGELGPDGDVSVQTPQCVGTMYDQNTGNQIPMYLVNVREEKVENPDGTSYYTFVENTDASTIHYKWDGESLTLTDGIIGECFWMPDIDKENKEGWMWYGVCDLSEKFAPCTYQTQIPPENLTYEEFIMTYSTEDGDKLGQKIMVGFDGDECWIKNLHPILTDFYVKGTKSENGYKFPNQYLGPVREVGYHAFFRPGYYEGKDGVHYIGDKPEIELALIHDTKELVSPENSLWLINAGNGKLYYFQRNEDPRLSPYSMNESTRLKSPEIIEFISPMPEYGIPGTFVFKLHPFNAENGWLDTEFVSFNVYVNDGIFTFTTNDYPDLTEDTDELPYLLSPTFYDALRSENQFTINIYSEDISKIGVKMNFDNGVTIASSEMAAIEVSGINLPCENEVSTDSVEYFDLTGNRISNPGTGISIMSETFSDGTRKVSKIMRR